MPRTARRNILSEILAADEPQILTEWLSEQKRTQLTGGRISDAELEQQSRSFLNELSGAARSGNITETERVEWSAMRALLAELSRSRAQQGFTPAQTATFIFSLRGVLLDRLARAYADDSAGLAEEVRLVSALLDRLALLTAEAALAAREEIIKRQQEEMLELYTPVVQLYPGILGLPLIGTLDSARTQVVMENLLQSIVSLNAKIAIIDITGVPTVDTLVAQHLLKTVAAARLMGADCILSGIRPQIAQTIVHLGVELENVATKATLADALALAFHRLGLTVHKHDKERESTTRAA